MKNIFSGLICILLIAIAIIALGGEEALKKIDFSNCQQELIQNQKPNVDTNNDDNKDNDENKNDSDNTDIGKIQVDKDIIIFE